MEGCEANFQVILKQVGMKITNGSGQGLICLTAYRYTIYSAIKWIKQNKF